MIIKKYQGKTEEEALAVAKKELGNAVVLMNVKQVKKKGLFSIFKPQMVEVTVALEEETNDNSADLRSAVAAVSEIAQSQMKKEEKKEPVKVEVAEEKKETPSKDDSGIEEKLNTLQSMLEKQMGQKEADEEKEKNENIEFFY